MSLADYYGIPEEAANRMVKNGHVSCSVLMHLEIYEAYKKIHNAPSSQQERHEIYATLADRFKVSHSTVKQVVLKMDKKS